MVAKRLSVMIIPKYDWRDAVITASNGVFFDLVNGGEKGGVKNTIKRGFRVGTKPEIPPTNITPLSEEQQKE